MRGDIKHLFQRDIFTILASRLIWFLQPQVCVGGRPPTSGVEDNSEGSTASIGEVGEAQFTVSRFEAFAGTQEAGPPEPQTREG